VAAEEKPAPLPEMGRAAAAKTGTVRPNRWSSVILFTTVALAPLPFGSVHPIVVAFWCLLLGIGLFTATPADMRGGRRLLAALAATVVMGLIVVACLQVVTGSWPASLAARSVWDEAAKLLETPLQGSVAIARNQPLFALGPPLAAIAAMICSFVVCMDRSRAGQLLQVIAWSGLAYAAFGILSFLNDPSKVLWRDKPAYTTVLTGTFINRNTAAVFFGTCAIIWFLTACDSFARLLPPDSLQFRAAIKRLSPRASRRLSVQAAVIVICTAAMFMTASRAGIVLSLGAMIVSFVIFFHRRLAHGRAIAGALVLGGIAALVALQVLGSSVSERFEADGVSDSARMAAYQSTLRMIADHPWLGTGLGTFAWRFPAYRSPDITFNWVWDRAHSTVLELAAELGIPLALLILAAWIVIFLVLLHGIRVRRRGLLFPCAAIAIFGLVSLHSLIDFSLQIPGFAIVAFALIGAGLAQSFRSERSRISPSDPA
jgi:O-antigen ligase